MTAELKVSPAERPPRSWLRLVLDPTFGPYILGRLLSSAGVWIHNIVSALLTYGLTESAFMVGLVSVAQFAPQLLFAPLSGAMADRGDRKRQAILGRLVVTAGSGLLALWLWLPGLGPQADAAAVVIAAGIVGLGFVTGGPAMYAMVPSLVRRNELSAAVTINMVPVTLARAAGPAVGAGVALGLGSTTAFLVAALGNAGFALALTRVRLPPRKPASDADRSVRAGLRFVRRDPVTAYLLIGVTAVGFGSDPAITLVPVLSEEMGHGSTYAGAFASAFGVGAGLAFVVIPLLRERLGVVRYGTLGFVLMAAGLLAVLPVTTPWGAMGPWGVAGMGMTLALTSLSSQLQDRLPDEFRGRVMALWTMGFLGSRPLAAAMDGAIADLFSVDVALAFVAVLIIAAAWLCRPGRVAP